MARTAQGLHDQPQPGRAAAKEFQFSTDEVFIRRSLHCRARACLGLNGRHQQHCRVRPCERLTVENWTLLPSSVSFDHRPSTSSDVV
jgi:hypothetical protein